MWCKPDPRRVMFIAKKEVLSGVARLSGLMTIAILALIWANALAAMTLDQRRALDLSSYVVTDPSAGFFDVSARQSYLEQTQDLLLIDAMRDQENAISCRMLKLMPPLNHEISLPGYYQDNQAWTDLVKPFHDFEDGVSGLAAAYVVTSDRYYSDCLLDLLVLWADAGAFKRFNLSSNYKQGWYQIESTLFAAALALSTVQGALTERIADLFKVKNWLREASHIHIAIDGADDGSCCNNHFYRRALHATAIGILANDNDLFRFGVSAIYSALSDASPSGGLRLELARGELAAHYQNFAVGYLVMIAELMERQGYSAYQIDVGGLKLHDIISFNTRLLENPSAAKEFSGTDVMSESYLEVLQFFAWIEIYIARFADHRLDAIAMPRRPIYNRSLGGELSLFFYRGD